MPKNNKRFDPNLNLTHWRKPLKFVAWNWLDFHVFLAAKAIQGAKAFGSFFYSAVNKAGARVSEASAKIKESVATNVSTNIFHEILETIIKI